MQDAKNPLHAFWPKVHKDDVPNAARPVNRAAEIRLIRHGLAFLLTYMAGRVGEAKVGVFNKCWHCRAQMSHSSHPLGCPHTRSAQMRMVSTQFLICCPKLCITQYTFSNIPQPSGGVPNVWWLPSV